MTDQEQYDLLMQMRFEMSAPGEFIIRDLARQAVEMYTAQPPLTGVLVNGAVYFPVSTHDGYRDIKVRLTPYVLDHPQEAQLIAEQQIREQWRKS